MEALQLIALIIVCVVFRFAALALIVWYEAYYSDAADRIRTVYTNQGRRCVLLGLFNLVAWTFVAMLLISTKVLALFGLALFACLIGAALISFAPAYRELGERLDGAADRSRTRNLFYGFLCLEAAFMTPFVGQLLAFGVLVRGLGAVVTAMLAIRRGDTPPDPVGVAPSPTSEADATT